MGILFPFLGGSYTGRSSDLNAQRTINYYLELDNKEGKSPKALIGTPGLVGFANSNRVATVRKMHVFGDSLYAVIGSKVFKSTTGGVLTSLGTLGSSSGNIWMADNGVTGNQLMIVDGSDNKGYIYNQSTEVFGVITDPDFPDASSLTFQDGFFIVTEAGTQKFFISKSFDGTDWDALDFESTAGEEDDLVSCISDHREIWFFGTATTEVWYREFTTSFPFGRKIDDIIQRGCGAAASIAREDNTIFWLDEQGMARRAVGYVPQIISTPQIHFQWAKYSTFADAIGYTYIQEGHTFYVLTFPTGNATWVYDVSTDEWHERASYPTPYDNRWRGNCYAFFDNKRLVGDHANGKIYELDLDTFTDDGKIIKAIRQCQVIHSDRKLVFTDRLEIDHQSGVGLVKGQGVDPIVVLDWSDDGGQTYSNEHWKSLGKIGEYTKRTYWNRLGRSRNRIYRETITDPVRRVIVGAMLDATVGEV